MDREIDKQIAEKLFGIKVIHDCFNGGFRDYRGKMIKATFNPRGNYIYDENKKNIPSYSTNIKEAWKVVEKLIDKDIHINIRHTLNDNMYAVDCLIRSKKWKGTWETTEWYVTHKSAPMAICKAALMALETEKQDNA